MKKLLLLFCLTLFIFAESQAQVVVIVNKNVKAGSLSASAIANIYRLEKKSWEDGTKIVVIDSKVESTKGKFYSFIGQNPAELKKAWLKLQLTGEGKAPEALNSDEDIVKKVGSTKGAIGFVNKSAADDAVKIITTIK
jgi:ABC-type phosphate transport system substrate-binding protein